MSGSMGIEGLVGRTFNGYTVTRYIARGGMGVVYEANQNSLDRPVAIKFLFPYLSEDATFRDRFQREARAIARLNHPNIVRVLDFGYEDGLHYMVMDLIDSESLRQRLVRARDEGMSLQVPTILNILRQIAGALTYAHELGLVHRDVKPGNILLAANGRAFLGDFGVVKLMGNSQITATGALVGTPDYMAPEQSSGAVDIGPASDQYSLAVVAFEMLTARVPFTAPTPVAVMHKHMVEPPPSPRSIAPWIPEAAEQVLLRALAKHPRDRYPTVDEFVTRLTEAFDNAATGTFAVPDWQNAPTIVGHAATSGAGSVPGTPPPYLAGGQQGQPTQAGGVLPSATTAGGDLTSTAAGGAPWSTTPTGAATPPPQQTSGGPPTYPPPGAPADDSGDSSSPKLAGLVVVAALIALVAGYYFFMGRGDGDVDPTPGGFGATDATATSVVAPTPTEETATEVAEATATTGEADPAPTPTEGTADPTVTSGVTAEDTPTAEPVVEATETEPSATETTSAETATPGVPDGYREVIFFASHRGDVHDSQIYMMNIDGSDQQQVTFARGHSWGPRLSPDGERFFFSSVAPGEHQVHTATGGGTEGSGNHDIYISDVDGRNLSKLTFDLAWENGWSWSPDGEWIAFTTDQDGNWEIYLMTPDGQNFTRLTNDPADDGWPSFTPDGKQIVFTSNRSGNSEIYIMDVDGGNVQQLTNMSDTYNTYPYVSPDGARIVFSAQIQLANEGEIWVMGIDGSNPTRLTHTVALNYAPSWSPDGSKIVFASDRDGNHNIYIMNADGSDQTRLTTDPGEDTTPSWGYIRVSE